MKKRILSSILALTMLLGLSPAVFADETAPAMENLVTTEVSDEITTEAELQDAFESGGTVTLGGDIDLSESAYIPPDTTVLLDLNGYDLWLLFDWNAATIINAGQLFVDDSSGDNSGEIFGTWCAIDSYGTCAILGGTIGADSTAICNDGTLMVQGGYINAPTAIFNIHAYGLSIDGGSFYSRQIIKNYTDPSEVCEINSGIFEIWQTGYEATHFTNYIASTSDWDQDGRTYTVVSVGVVTGIASVNGYNYTTLEAAMAAAQSGDVVSLYADATLTQDITDQSGITIAITSDVVLDLAGYQLSAALAVDDGVALTVVDSGDTGRITSHTSVLSADDASLTIYGGTFVTTGDDAVVNTTENTQATITGGTYGDQSVVALLDENLGYHLIENEDGSWTASNLVSITATAQDNLATPTITSDSGDGELSYGSTITLSTPIVSGYTFTGWYQVTEAGETLVSSSRTYSFSLESTDELDFVAYYQENVFVTVTVSGVDFAVTSPAGTEIVNGTLTVPAGTSVTLEATTDAGDDGVFTSWSNATGLILSSSETYTFTASSNSTVYLIRTIYAEATGVITFVNYSYQQVDSWTGTVDEIAEMTLPEVPSRQGYEAGYWVIDGTEEAVTSADLSAKIQEMLDAGQLATLTVVATYDTMIETTYTVTANGGTVTNADGEETSEFKGAEPATVKADDPEEGMQFSHWENAAGTVVSYNATYSFYVSTSVALTAIYVESESSVTAVGTATMVYFTEENGQWSAVADFTVPTGCSIIEAGIAVLYSNGTLLGEYLGVADTSSYRHTLSFGSYDASSFTVYAVLRYLDDAGLIIEITSEPIACTLVS